MTPMGPAGLPRGWPVPARCSVVAPHPEHPGHPAPRPAATGRRARPSPEAPHPPEGLRELPRSRLRHPRLHHLRHPWLHHPRLPRLHRQPRLRSLPALGMRFRRFPRSRHRRSPGKAVPSLSPSLSPCLASEGAEPLSPARLSPHSPPSPSVFRCLARPRLYKGGQGRAGRGGVCSGFPSRPAPASAPSSPRLFLCLPGLGNVRGARGEPGAWAPGAPSLRRAGTPQ